MKTKKSKRPSRMEKKLEQFLISMKELRNSQPKTDAMQRKTDKQIAELREAQLKTDEQIAELKEAQLKTDAMQNYCLLTNSDTANAPSSPCEQTYNSYGAEKILGEGLLNIAAVGILSKTFKFAPKTGANVLQKALSKAKPTKGHPNQLMHELDDGTRIVFRKDFGEKAHSLGGPLKGKGKIDHYNVQVQNAKGKTIVNLHIVPDEKGGFIRF